MPPERIYLVTARGDAKAELIISPDSSDFLDLLRTYPTFSKTVGERDVQDAKGEKFGKDRWGYLPSGERWRYVRFSTGDRVAYQPLAPQVADKLDEIIGTACFVPKEEAKK
jgi:hypothetical protein